MTDKSVWDKEIPVAARLIQYVDSGVVKKLPPGTQVGEISPSGASYWARTAKIAATDAAGEETPFFIKVHQHEVGKSMVSAEFEAMTTLYELMPEMVAEPLGWGEYEEETDVWFFICRYRELSDTIPDVSDFPALLAEMHKRGASDKGEFGFPIVTYGGKNPQWFPVTKSWEESFTLAMERCFEAEEQVHGPDEELSQLREKLVTMVIPRLLRPLETDGRKVTPTLVHGDLWDGNASVDSNTGLPVIFDATPVYAHNEYELAPWWLSRHKMTDAYIEAYKEHYSPAEPLEDFTDRGHLYSLRFDLHSSSLYEGNLRFRKGSKDTMRGLIDKYPLGYAGYLNEQAAKKNANLGAVMEAGTRGIDVDAEKNKAEGLEKGAPGTTELSSGAV